GDVDRAIDAFCDAATEGLWPASYATPELAEAIEQTRESKASGDAARSDQLAHLDLLLTQAYMAYASDLLTGRVDPREVGAGWHAPLHRIDLASVLADSTGNGARFDLHRLLADRHEAFGQLREALQRYRQIAAGGGWNTVPEGEALEPGDTGERVTLLRRRLITSGDLSASDASDTSAPAVYDAALAAAVARFQWRHGLEPDSVAGEDVIAAMNVPIEARIHQIELNLERWRWIPANLGNRYIYVNIPAFELHAFDGGREALSMRVVVGKEYNDQATPVFADTMQYVVFNPYWNVPESIAAEELLPRARRDPGYLARNRYEVVRGWDGGAIGSPGAGDLDRVESGDYRIRQLPGRGNALGQVKFMFPNQFNIYLHDTPEEHLFERADRAYSHGCIRVEEPTELAKYVFAGSMSESEIREHMEGDTEETVSLSRPLPVYILYWTAFVDEGAVHFRGDLYGQDAALDNALTALRPAASGNEACASIRAAAGMEDS
ncbi:MAG TPA: L,D-transpeptidase family protein, partial [Rhodothermales bacterium]